MKKIIEITLRMMWDSRSLEISFSIWFLAFVYTMAQKSKHQHFFLKIIMKKMSFLCKNKSFSFFPFWKHFKNCLLAKFSYQEKSRKKLQFSQDLSNLSSSNLNLTKSSVFLQGSLNFIQIQGQKSFVA